MKTQIALGAVALLHFAAFGASAASAQSMGGRGTTSSSGSMMSTGISPSGSTGTVVIPSVGYGPGAYSPGYGTIAGSSFAGLGAFASGLGEYNYNTALAIRQLEDAKRQAIDNQVYAQKSQIEMRRLNNIQWLADHPRSTPEQVAKINDARLPRRLSTSQLDPTWGSIPGRLFCSDRSLKRSARRSTTSSPTARANRSVLAAPPTTKCNG